MRVLGIDLGSKRIGVALSNTERTVATPYSVLHRTLNKSKDHQAIKLLAEEWESGLLIVGLPLSLDGSLGPAAKNVLDEIQLLQVNTGLEVESIDERYSTTSAKQSLQAQGISEKEQKMLVDKVAASIILQTWLDKQMNAFQSVERVE